MAPQIAPLSSPNGTLRFSFGATLLEFRDCMIDSSNLDVSGGGYITTLHILDRRWKWAFGGVFGEYNRRDAAGMVLPDTELAPPSLARKLLAAMYEPPGEADNLPASGRPYIRWEGANPARELESLCQQLGYFVTLDVDDNLRIVKQGTGQPLPESPLVMQVGTSLNPPEKPDRMTVFGAATRFQAWLKLQPVGLEIDGRVLPINELSYMPSGGWETEPNTFPNLRGTDQTADQRRALAHAIATIWRWFRIHLEDSPDPDLRLRLPAEFELPDITDIQYILPVSSELVETEQVGGVVRRQQSKVFGIHAKGTAGEKFNSNEEPALAASFKQYAPLNIHRKQILYAGDFTLHEQFGIVEFPRQVLRWDRAQESWIAPDLFLQCSFNLRDPRPRPGGTGALFRYAYDYDTGARFGTGSEMIAAQDRLQRQMYQVLSLAREFPEWLDVAGRESRDLDREAHELAQDALSRYQNIQASETRYAGLHRISPDGAIRQVTWVVGESGATTHASRNCESNPLIPKIRERRFLENMCDLLVDSQARLPLIPGVV